MLFKTKETPSRELLRATAVGNRPLPLIANRRRVLTWRLPRLWFLKVSLLRLASEESLECTTWMPMPQLSKTSSSTLKNEALLERRHVRRAVGSRIRQLAWLSSRQNEDIVNTRNGNERRKRRRPHEAEMNEASSRCRGGEWCLLRPTRLSYTTISNITTQTLLLNKEVK